jgi:formylglycine-generating enzyme required for sulfatase activity
MKFVVIKGGRFKMGDAFNEGDKDETPVHEVAIAGFAMGKYAVTRGEFKKFIAATNYRTDAEKGNGCYIQAGMIWDYDSEASWRNPGFMQDDNHPVVCVSWNDATAFAGWVSKLPRRYGDSG